MKYLLMVGIIALFSFLGRQEYIQPTKDPNTYLSKKKITAITCSPLRDRSIAELGIGILPGTATSLEIDTKADSAQIYFDQGMNYYSFHIINTPSFHPDLRQRIHALLGRSSCWPYINTWDTLNHLMPECSSDASKYAARASS
jgi:hypothetical protein